MNNDDIKKIFNINDILDMPNAIMKLLDGNLDERNKVYRQLLALNNFDVSFDWFSEIYETELAQRKQNKQDFTPNSISVLCSRLTGTPKGKIHEPTAGNGAMIIADWHNRCNNYTPWEHFPSEHQVTCWELSDRAIPILLLNLSIRGIMGYVYHGDVLHQTIKAKYILLNRKNDSLGFSEIIKDVNNNLIIKQL